MASIAFSPLDTTRTSWSASVSAWPSRLAIRASSSVTSTRTRPIVVARRRRSADALQALAQRVQLGDQLRRLVHLDVGAKHRDPHREPLQVVVGRAVLAAAIVDR